MKLADVIEFLLRTGTVVRTAEGRLRMRRDSEPGCIAKETEWGFQTPMLHTDCYPERRSNTARTTADELSSCDALGNRKSGSAERNNARVGKLISNLRHPDWVVAASAAGELAGIGEEAKDAIPVMIQLLSSPDADVRGHMARALGYFGPVASSAVDDLKRLLGDKANCWHEDVADSFPVRFRAAFAIGNVNPTNEEVLPVVCEALTRENHHARKEAHGFVRRYGKDNDLFVPILKKEVEHRDPLRQMFARITLAIIDPGYDDQDETVRRLAETWRSDSSVHQSPNSRNA